MVDRCVACDEIAEGKPLYKKLGGHPEIEVYDALVKINFTKLLPSEKYNYYLCWDCDELIAEEYAEFCAKEKKKIDDAKRQKEQDTIRTQKLNKKLKKAFQKVHQIDQCNAKGLPPPVSKYRRKEQNKYHASHCLQCNCAFENRNGFQRYHLRKMIDGDTRIYDALKLLGNIQQISESDQLKRFICSTCYNKLRRNFKTTVGGNTSDLTAQTNGNTGNLKCKTVDEHAAEIAKLLPPDLAGMYKIVGKTSPKKLESSNHSHSQLSVGSGHSKSKLKNHHSTKNHQKPSTLRTINPNGSVHVSPSGSNVVESAVCNVCGLCFTGRPHNFWCKLDDPLPMIPGATVRGALKKLQTQLADVGDLAKERGYVCRVCHSRISVGLSNMLQPKTKKKSIPHVSSPKKISVTPVVSMVPQPQKKQSPKTKSPIAVYKRQQSSSHKKSVQKDMDLLRIINKSKHLRYKGKLVVLKRITIKLLDVFRLLPGTSYIPIEHIRNLYLYTNFGRKPFKKAVCVFCKLSTNLKYSHWTDDPIHPPNLMVPIKWAQMSINANQFGDLARVNGLVCSHCHDLVKENFIKFACERILVNTSLSVSEALKTYKISFDSKSMTVIADFLKDSPVTDFNETNNRVPQYTHKLLNGHSESTESISPSINGTDSKCSTPPIVESASKSTLKDLDDSFNLSDDLALSDTDDDDETFEPLNSIHKSIVNNAKEVPNQPVKKYIPYPLSVQKKKELEASIPVKVDKQTESIPKPVETEKSPVAVKKKTEVIPKPVETEKSPVKVDKKMESIPKPVETKKAPVKVDEQTEFMPKSVGTKKSPVNVEEKNSHKRCHDELAPFTQRKKPRGSRIVGSPVAPKSHKPLQNLWQTMQQISFDELVRANTKQPIKPHQFTYGLFLAMNEYRKHLGATVEELIVWLDRIFPEEWSSSNKILCVPVLHKHVLNLEDPLWKHDANCLDEPIPNIWIQDAPVAEKYVHSCVSLVTKWPIVNITDLLQGTCTPVPQEQFDMSLLEYVTKACHFLKINIKKSIKLLFPYLDNKYCDLSSSFPNSKELPKISVYSVNSNAQLDKNYNPVEIKSKSLQQKSIEANSQILNGFSQSDV